VCGFFSFSPFFPEGALFFNVLIMKNCILLRKHNPSEHFKALERLQVSHDLSFMESAFRPDKAYNYRKK
jgi:hypothetical protein